MTSLLKKLNYKEQAEILMLNSPQSFDKVFEEMGLITNIRTNLRGVKEINFIMIFATKKAEIEKYFDKIINLLNDDTVLWFAYPKGTSKNYKCDFNRDTGWEILGDQGYEGVRIVSIDEDWTALRFRKADKIKKMTRRKSMAISKTGKKKTKGD